MEIKLSENQKKNTLNAKKKAKGPKNVLTSSLPEYWPVLNEVDFKEFSDLLKKITQTTSSLKDTTSFGLQSSLRNIKNFKCSFLILDDNVSPRWFAKHLISMALTRDFNIKVIIVPKLKELTKEIFKISSISLCINSQLEVLEKFHRNLNIQEDLLKHYGHKKDGVKRVKRKTKTGDSQSVPIVHLKRSSGHPAFRPSNEIKMETDDDEFISLKKYEEPVKKQSESIYRPMKIKQVFPNPNRKKK